MTERPFTLLFVCSGNTCRSPLAEAVGRREAERLGMEGWLRVLSAGTGAFSGGPASEGSTIVASRHGLDLADHRSSLLTAELLGEADLVLGMSPGHVARARDLEPGGHVELLGTFAAGGETGRAVPDPFGAPVEVYEQTYRVIEELVAAAVQRLAADMEAE
jgi:protein-tyrosine-phosphatase